MINVLFVCLGNICRSPMADGVFQHLVKEAGLSDAIHVDSAGTGGWHIGEMAHRGTRQVLKKNNIPYDGRARQFGRTDFDRFEYILTMDHSNFNNVIRMIPESGASHHQDYAILEDGTEISMFLRYAAEAGHTSEIEVPDPYYDNKFDYVYDLVSIGAADLLSYIREKHAL
jgi:protein-tyrosine phosphatase